MAEETRMLKELQDGVNSRLASSRSGLRISSAPKSIKGVAADDLAYAMDSVDEAAKILDSWGFDKIAGDRVTVSLEGKAVGRGLRANADFNPNIRHIRTFPKERIWNRYTQKYTDGWSSNTDAIGTMIHEYGHAAHWNNIKSMPNYVLDELWSSRRWRNAAHEAIAREVSRYAATKPVEFIAETFAGIVREGKTYSKEVMDLYYSMKGPKIPESIPQAALDAINASRKTSATLAERFGREIPAGRVPVTPPRVTPPQPSWSVPKPPPEPKPPVPTPPPAPIPKPPPAPPPAPKPPKAQPIKVTDADKARVIELRKQGMSYEKIEAAMGWPPSHGNRAFKIIKAAQAAGLL